jgi:intracellular sulfur oxidation DsrE/DsrF family protein
MKPTLFLALLCSLYALSGTASASSDAEVQALLKQSKPPAGVVFEIVSSSADALRWAIPTVSRYADQLRARFPELEIAVVTHGNEQFALLDARAQTYRKVHDEVRTLTQNKGVNVHVCGTLAGWKNIAPEEFPAYVEVAAAGPAMINDYRALGYTLIQVQRPAASR